jgi:hypothetical protein
LKGVKLAGNSDVRWWLALFEHDATPFDGNFAKLNANLMLRNAVRR